MATPVHDGDKNHSEDSAQGQQIPQDGNNKSLVNLEVVKDFGPSMVATRKSRKNFGMDDDRERGGGYMGRKKNKERGISAYGRRHQSGQNSRFSVLNEEDERKSEQDLDKESLVEVDLETSSHLLGKAPQLGNKGRRMNVQV